MTPVSRQRHISAHRGRGQQEGHEKRGTEIDAGRIYGVPSADDGISCMCIYCKVLANPEGRGVGGVEGRWRGDTARQPNQGTRWREKVGGGVVAASDWGYGEAYGVELQGVVDHPRGVAGVQDGGGGGQRNVSGEGFHQYRKGVLIVRGEGKGQHGSNENKFWRKAEKRREL